MRIGFAWCVNDIDVHHSTDDFSIIKNLVRRDNMTEKEFEQRIDAAADRFEKNITKKWNNNKCFRRSMKSISIMAETGLILGAEHLAMRGYKTAAAWCARLGIVGVISDIITSIIFRKR